MGRYMYVCSLDLRNCGIYLSIPCRSVSVLKEAFLFCLVHGLAQDRTNTFREVPKAQTLVS